MEIVYLDSKASTSKLKEKADKVSITKPADPNQKEPKVQTGVERVTFVGGVQIEDDQFAMYAAKLNVLFDTIDPKTGTRQISTILAQDGVHVEVDEGLIEARRLQVDMKINKDGDPEPSRILAEGNVYVADKTQRLWTDHLVTELAEKTNTPKTKSPAETKKTSSRKSYASEIKSLKATQGVRLLLLKDNTLVIGDRLEANTLAQEAKLFGSPVRIIKHANAEQMAKTGVIGQLNEGTDLRVIQLHIKENGTYALAEGPGEFHYVQDIAPAIDVKPNAPKNIKPSTPRAVDVNWKQLMRFHDNANTIEMVGKVNMAITESPTEQNTLAAHHVIINMVDQKLVNKIKGKDKENPNTSTRRVLRSVTAKTNVVLKATRWKDAKRNFAEIRFRLSGENLLFDDAVQRATIQGPGNMLIEDYREDKKPKPNDKAPVKLNTEKKIMSGKGATVFQWEKSMRLESQNKKLYLDGNVVMAHQPIGGNKLIKLKANRLEVDLKEKVAIGVNKMAQVQSLEIEHILAEGAVELQQGNRIISAPVRVYYDGSKQIMLLQGTDANPVEIIDLNQPKPLRAKYILWDLQKDRFEVIDANL